MAKVKIVTVIGARPQFIKAAAVSRLIRKNFSEVIVHTGQHYNKEMSGDFFKELKIPNPDYNLGADSSARIKQLAIMLDRIDSVLNNEKPHFVLVYGDTNSTLAGALAASMLNIPIIHIESGLRSFRRDMPEEINRVLTDHLSTFLFCPTKNAVNNLRREGVYRGVYNVGDVMYDTLLFYLKKAKKKSRILENLNIKANSYFLATIHRADNTDSRARLKKIIDIFIALNDVVLFPAHPRTEKMLKNFNIKIDTDKIRLIKPVSYFDMLILEANAKAILTDSGGVQKEAYLLNVPCLVLREETEWIETVRGGSNFITGLDKDKITKLLKKLHDRKIQNNLQFFGDGKAARKISAILKRKLNGFYS